jgi:hypothetical protein
VDGRVISSDVNKKPIHSMGILIFEGLTTRRLYKSLGIKGLKEILINIVVESRLRSASLEQYLCSCGQIRPELLSDSEKLKDIPERLKDWRILKRTFLH